MLVYTVLIAKISHIWHGILTGQNNYRILNAVIERFYRLGRIIDIIGLVPFLQQWIKRLIIESRTCRKLLAASRFLLVASRKVLGAPEGLGVIKWQHLYRHQTVIT